MTKSEYLELVAKIEHYNDQYYNQDGSDITDAEFDALTQRLKAIEAEHPEWVTAASPSQHVGGSAMGANKTKHMHKLLSLDDKFSFDEVKAWYEGIDSPDCVVEHKIDGLTVALTYIDGELTLGATRGDGVIGEIVTENARHIKGIPQRLKLPASAPAHNLLVVRAEVYQPVSEWKRCNILQLSRGLKPFANPRNCASGGLRASDPAVTAERGLCAFAFQCIASENLDELHLGLAQSADVMILDDLGFATVPQYEANSFDKIVAAINTIDILRPSLDYWIDGAVIKTDDLKLQKQIGATEKYPLHSVAYKYAATTRSTIVRDIEVSTGRTGVLTPVAVFDPIQLAGTTVTHATLHNQKFIDDMGIAIGSEIQVLKSGEIIPKVVSVSQRAAQPFKITTCPSCGHAAVLFTDENGTDNGVMGCPNFNGCPAQKARYFEFFCSKPVMDISGMGPAVIDGLIAAGLLNTVQDIYRLKTEAKLPTSHALMLSIDKMGEKKLQKLLDAIEASKSNDIDRLIKALGIPGVGRHIGKALAERYPDMEVIRNLSYDELVTIDGVGEISANAILNFWNDPVCVQRYEDLKALGVNIKSMSYHDNSVPASNLGPLSDLNFCITGTFAGVTRADLEKFITSNGGKMTSSVTKQTDYLVVGDKAGSKLAKAKATGVACITEQELLAMVTGR